jgi:hypothetical protein
MHRSDSFAANYYLVAGPQVQGISRMIDFRTLRLPPKSFWTVVNCRQNRAMRLISFSFSPAAGPASFLRNPLIVLPTSIQPFFWRRL